MLNTIYLGYSKKLDRDLTLEYEWDTYLCCDSEYVPMLKIKATHKHSWHCYKCITNSEEYVLNQAIETFKNNYLVI